MEKPLSVLVAFFVVISTQAYVDVLHDNGSEVIPETSFDDTAALMRDTFSVSDQKQIFDFLKIFTNDVEVQKSMVERFVKTRVLNVPLGSLLGANTKWWSGRSYIPIAKGWICWPNCLTAKCGHDNSSNRAVAKKAATNEHSKTCKKAQIRAALMKARKHLAARKAEGLKLSRMHSKLTKLRRRIRKASGKTKQQLERKLKRLAKLHRNLHRKYHPPPPLKDVLKKLNKGLKQVKWSKKVNKRSAMDYFKKYIYTDYASGRL